MTDAAVTAWLIASIPLLTVAAILLYLLREWVRGRKPRRLSKQVLTREYDSYMGRWLRNYKPRTTIHSIVNGFHSGLETEYKPRVKK